MTNSPKPGAAEAPSETSKILTAQGSTVYETVSGILGRHVASFSYPEDAAAYVDWMNNRDTRHQEVMAGIGKVKDRVEIDAAQITRLSADLAAKESTIADLRAWIERAAAEAGRQVGEAQARIAELEAQLAEANAKAKSYRADAINAVDNLEGACAYSAELEARLAEYKGSADQLQALVDKACTRAEKASADLAAANERGSEWRTLCEQSVELGKKAEAERDQAFQSADIQLEACNAAESQLATLRALLVKALPIIEDEADRRDYAPAEDGDGIPGYSTEMRALADEISAALRPDDGAGEKSE